MRRYKAVRNGTRFIIVVDEEGDEYESVIAECGNHFIADDIVEALNHMQECEDGA